MSKAWILLRTSMLNYFSIYETIDKKSNKRNGTLITSVGIASVLIFLCAYNALTAISLSKVGQTGLIPAYMIGVSSFAVLFMTIFYSNGILFGSKDFERLSSLPVKGRQIIVSKFSFMYLMNLAICFIFIIPGGVVWLINSEISFDRIIVYFISVLFTPLIPMCSGGVLGILISYFSSKTKRKNIFALVFSFLTLASIIAIALSSMSSQGGAEVGATLIAQVTGLYPLSKWFLFNENENIFLPIAFILLSTITFLIFIIVAGSNYTKINHIVSKQSSNIQKPYNIIKRSRFIALFEKEIGRFFGSYLYVLNAGLGVVLLCLFNMIIIFVNTNYLSNILGISNVTEYLTIYAPIIVSTFLSLSCPSASSISLEGINIWILKSSPISMKTVVDSKIAFTNFLHFIPYLLSVIAMGIKFEITGFNLVFLLVVPITYSIFTAILGIYFNMKYPNFKWESEVVVIKQSIPVILSSLIIMVSIVIPALILTFTNINLWIVYGITSLTLIILSKALYKKIGFLELI